MVVAYWHAVKEAKRNEVKVGTGEPVSRLKMYYPTQEMALAAARSELDRRERRKVTVSVTLPGRTDLVAEGRLILKGFRDGVNGEWSIKRAEHTLGDGGYVTTVEAETPNSGETPPAEDVAD
jgi:phage protein D